VACELPWRSGVPLSRFSHDELAREVIERGIVAQISGTTVWRWLSQDAIRSWQHRSWIFPRDPDFAAKAARVLDLYQGIWQDQPLGEDEYTRGGALAYLAAWDVRRARVFGRCEATTGIKPFDRLVEQVMSQEPYRSAQRVFWIVDNGSSHRGMTCVVWLQTAWGNLVLVHLPVHASWLNQVAIYFSVVQRKVLTPNDFASLDEVAARLFAFKERYAAIAKPFAWKFTRHDLSRLLDKLSAPREPEAAVA